MIDTPDSKVHGTNMGPTWVLSAPDGPHAGPMNLVIRNVFACKKYKSRVSCQKGPTRHAYAWQIGPFWQDTLEMSNIQTRPHIRGPNLIITVLADALAPIAVVSSTGTQVTTKWDPVSSNPSIF